MGGFLVTLEYDSTLGVAAADAYLVFLRRCGFITKEEEETALANKPSPAGAEEGITTGENRSSEEQDELGSQTRRVRLRSVKEEDHLDNTINLVDGMEVLEPPKVVGDLMAEPP